MQQGHRSGHTEQVITGRQPDPRETFIGNQSPEAQESFPGRKESCLHEHQWHGADRSRAPAWGTCFRGNTTCGARVLWDVERALPLCLYHGVLHFYHSTVVPESNRSWSTPPENCLALWSAKAALWIVGCKAGAWRNSARTFAWTVCSVWHILGESQSCLPAPAWSSCSLRWITALSTQQSLISTYHIPVSHKEVLLLPNHLGKEDSSNQKADLQKKCGGLSERDLWPWRQRSLPWWDKLGSLQMVALSRSIAPAHPTMYQGEWVPL